MAVQKPVVFYVVKDQLMSQSHTSQIPWFDVI